MADESMKRALRERKLRLLDPGSVVREEDIKKDEKRDRDKEVETRKMSDLAPETDKSPSVENDYEMIMGEKMPDEMVAARPGSSLMEKMKMSMMKKRGNNPKGNPHNDGGY